jgi:hypothetical protein
MFSAAKKTTLQPDQHSTYPSDLRLRKATQEDVDDLAQVCLIAFAKNPWFNSIFPQTKASYDWLRFSFSEDIRNPNSHFICVYDSSIPWEPIVSWV